jgi:hypothetical protein
MSIIDRFGPTKATHCGDEHIDNPLGGDPVPVARLCAPSALKARAIAMAAAITPGFSTAAYPTTKADAVVFARGLGGWRKIPRPHTMADTEVWLAFAGDHEPDLLPWEGVLDKKSTFAKGALTPSALPRDGGDGRYLVDPISWVQFRYNDASVMVSCEPLRLNGVRLVTTWTEALDVYRNGVAERGGAGRYSVGPLTDGMCAALFEHATRETVLVEGQCLANAAWSAPGWARETGRFRMGGWKIWTPPVGHGPVANWGLARPPVSSLFSADPETKLVRDCAGFTNDLVQHRGHRHPDGGHVDWSQVLPVVNSQSAMLKGRKASLCDIFVAYPELFATQSAPTGAEIERFFGSLERTV